MMQRLIFGSAHLLASLLVIQCASAQHVVNGDCSNGNCNGGHVAGGHFSAIGPNVEGFGARKHWIYHSSWGDYWARNQASQRPWHGDYYWLRTGQPTALVVPPVVTMQSNYSWGVSQNTMTPVYHQFGGVPPNGAGGGVGGGAGVGTFRATPYWPTHTDQFGIYPVRGPW